jgi:S1-C subfamily serine protease
MNRWLVSAGMFAAVVAATIPNAVANPDCVEPIPNLFERLSPSVVSISSVTVDPSDGDNRIEFVWGSGFVVGDDGLVLTNSHVVFDHQAIIVTMDDGRQVEPKLIGADPIYDLAVLRIPVTGKENPKVILGNSDSVRIGEDVAAIGNPLELEQSLTRGVVSGLNRFVPDSPMSLTLPLIQTDAPINPGNSGGPLFNRCGEVIGITTSMAADAQNIGFAVPINIAKQVLPELVQHGRVIRPWFGMTVKLISKKLMEVINMPLVDGLLVEKLDRGSPAQQAGIREGDLPVTVAGDEFLLGGDIITDMNGRSPNDSKGFAELVRSLKVGDTVRLTLYREKRTRQVKFKLVERPILPSDVQTNATSTLLHTDKRVNVPPLKQCLIRDMRR